MTLQIFMSYSLFKIMLTPRTWVVYILLLGVLTWICFGSLRFHLLDMHDPDTFRDSAKVSSDFTYFFSDQKEHSSGRLLHELCMWLAHLVWGEDPAAFHLLVVALHFVASLLLCQTFLRVGADSELSMLGGLLFLLNVAHFHAVHWISGLNYILGFVMSLTAVLAYLRCAGGGHSIWLAAFYGSLTLGAFSHLASLMAWPFCLFLSWIQGHDLRRALRHLVTFALLLVPTLALVLRSTTKQTSTWESLELLSAIGLWDLVFGIARSILWFASRLLSRAHWLPFVSHERQSWELAVGALVVAGLAWLIWKRVNPVAPWAGWILLMIAPFALLTEELILSQIMEPSRYLYQASAGSSLLLAWTILAASRHCGPWNRHVFALLLVGVLASSYIHLKKVEALSIYSSGRHYIATGDLDIGIAQYRRALAHGRDILPLSDIYYRLCNLLLTTGDEFKPILDEARAGLPVDVRIQALYYVVESLSQDPQGRETGRQKMNEALASSQALDTEEREAFRSMVATIFHCTALGLLQHGEVDRMVVALKTALVWDPQRDITRQLLAKVEEAIAAERVSRD